MSSSAWEIEASNRWWTEDNIVQHILISRLGTIPRGLLPASNIVTRTALSIYKLLLQYYGTSNFADCTSTLPSNITPFESLQPGRKPDLSHLRVWGCDCYVAVPDETRAKAGSKRFWAIFVGYEEHRIGWRVRDLSSKYSFSNDVIFNENLPARLGVPHSLPSHTPASVDISSPCPLHDRPHLRTTAGQAYDAVMEFKRLCSGERQSRMLLRDDGVENGGVVSVSVANGGVESVDASYGGCK